MTALVANTAVLIDALTNLDPRTSSQDSVCLALRALGNPDLAARYADAAARMSFWHAKPAHFEFAGSVFGDATDAWTDEDSANHERDQNAYWALVAEINATFGIAERA